MRISRIVTPFIRTTMSAPPKHLDGFLKKAASGALTIDDVLKAITAASLRIQQSPTAMQAIRTVLLLISRGLLPELRWRPRSAL